MIAAVMPPSAPPIKWRCVNALLGSLALVAAGVCTSFSAAAAGAATATAAAAVAMGIGTADAADFAMAIDNDFAGSPRSSRWLLSLLRSANQHYQHSAPIMSATNQKLPPPAIADTILDRQQRSQYTAQCTIP